MLEAFERRADTIIRLAFRDERGRSITLGVTPEHPFWRPSVGWTRVGWTRAGDLLAGQELLGLGTGRLTVVSVAVEPHPQGMAVFNLKVDEDHTYFVGDIAVWVHNANCVPEVGSRPRINEWQRRGLENNPENWWEYSNMLFETDLNLFRGLLETKIENTPAFMSDGRRNPNWSAYRASLRELDTEYASRLQSVPATAAKTTWGDIGWPIAQGGLNLLQAAQNGVVGTANAVIFENPLNPMNDAIATAGYDRLSIPSPDWTKDVAYREATDSNPLFTRQASLISGEIGIGLVTPAA